jgi:GNAT superfamily N-acetyltransferase
MLPENHSSHLRMMPDNLNSLAVLRRSAIKSHPWLLYRTMTRTDIHLRLAVPQDVPVLRELIDASVRGLQTQDYTPAQIEGALQTVFGVDSQLIADGTYIVAEAEAHAIDRARPKNAPFERIIVGCGGWSKRKTLYGGDHWTGREEALLDPHSDAAKIRAFFIHPDWARRGVGSMILQACENAARSAGFTRYEMGATLTGAKLFGARGYIAMKPISIPLVNGESLPVIHMEKQA